MSRNEKTGSVAQCYGWSGEICKAYGRGNAAAKAGFKPNPGTFRAAYMQGYEHGQTERLRSLARSERA
jgi:hypothetical protein